MKFKLKCNIFSDSLNHLSSLNADSVTYELPDKTQLELKEERIQVCEGLFNGDAMKVDRPVQILLSLINLLESYRIQRSPTRCNGFNK